MKLPENAVKIEGDLVGHRIDMKIDPNARAFIMQALQKLYSDREMAVLRELATNARDAHIDAGRAHLPIEISIQANELDDPYLVIKDFGHGLTIEDIENIYSRYGVSTKRDTNEQTGSLGFGCKSPLAYTDQFTLTSICNGVRILVLVSKDEGGGNMQIVDTSATDEHSGVTIQIPLARHHTFMLKAERLFRFWEPGTVLVNGKDPERIKGRKINDDLMIIDGRTSYLVMGNVPYPIDTDYLKHELNYEHSLVARVPLGSVQFVPSREALDYTAETRAVLKQIEQDFEIGIQTAIQKVIDQCQTRPEVVATILDWRRSLPEARVSGNYTYKGKPVPYVFDVTKDDEYRRAIATQRSSSKLSKHEKRQRLDITWWVNTLYVINYDREGFTPTTKKKLNKYANDNDIVCDNYVLLSFKPGRAFTQWLPKGMIVDFEKIAAVKLPRSYNGSGRVVDPNRIKGSYDLMIDGASKLGVPADKIDLGKPLFYYIGKFDEAWRYIDALKHDYPGSALVILSPNRVQKFTRTFPQAVYVRDGIKNAFKAWKRGLTENQKISISIYHGGNYGMRTSLAMLDPKLIDDPYLKRMIRITQTKKHAAVRDVYAMYARAGLGINAQSITDEIVNPLDRFPLYSDCTLRIDPEHIYQYLNAMHAYLTAQGR